MNEIYQHFKPEEKAFVDRSLDWLMRVENQGVSFCTHFLNPRERYILETLAQGRAVFCFLLSNCEPCLISAESDKSQSDREYAQVLLSQSSQRPSHEDFDSLLLEIRYNSKFKQLTHSQILGSILGQLGIERGLIGDILVQDGRAQVFVSRRIQRLLEQDLTKIAGIPVSWHEIPLTELLPVNKSRESKVLSVSSLRLDKIIAATLAISRNLALNMVQLKKVKVNYTPCDRNDLPLEIGDLVSIQGYGRLQLQKILGESKKGKLRVEISTMLHSQQHKHKK